MILYAKMINPNYVRDEMHNTWYNVCSKHVITSRGRFEKIQFDFCTK